MYFPQTAEYALRAMVYLASVPKGEKISGHELAGKTQVPSPYLSKIMRRMVLAELVLARRGHKGGFELARAPEDILFSEILEAAECLPSASRCAFGWAECDAEHPCPLHVVWSELAGAFSSWASTTSLGQVAWPLERLDKILEQRRETT